MFCRVVGISTTLSDFLFCRQYQVGTEVTLNWDPLLLPRVGQSAGGTNQMPQCKATVNDRALKRNCAVASTSDKHTTHKNPVLFDPGGIE